MINKKALIVWVKKRKTPWIGLWIFIFSFSRLKKASYASDLCISRKPVSYNAVIKIHKIISISLDNGLIARLRVKLDYFCEHESRLGFNYKKTLSLPNGCNDILKIKSLQSFGLGYFSLSFPILKLKGWVILIFTKLKMTLYFKLSRVITRLDLKRVNATV